MNKKEQSCFYHIIAARDRYKREVIRQRMIIVLLALVSIVSVSISIYCIYDRTQITNRVAEQHEDIERYKSELAEISKER